MNARGNVVALAGESRRTDPVSGTEVGLQEIKAGYWKDVPARLPLMITAIFTLSPGCPNPKQEMSPCEIPITTGKRTLSKNSGSMKRRSTTVPPCA